MVRRNWSKTKRNKRTWSTIQYINIQMVKEIVDKNRLFNSKQYCIVDIRSENQYNSCRIKGSINVHDPLEVLKYLFIGVVTGDNTQLYS